ncbi:hypothetical protein BS78_07G050600 [Paspalum vaginatum]|nr:hypothetical protein BS78_07G050600 [Paspalum vaginatum]
MNRKHHFTSCCARLCPAIFLHLEDPGTTRSSDSHEATLTTRSSQVLLSEKRGQTSAVPRRFSISQFSCMDLPIPSVMLSRRSCT